MVDRKGFHLLDYLEFLVKRKVLFLKVFFFSLVVIYLSVFIFVSEQFEASATIIPREDDASNLLAGGLLRSVKGLPLGLGGKSAGSETDLYKTIIYSRTMMEDVIRKFDLLQIYRLDTSDVSHMENAIKRLSREIGTKETEESAFSITVRATTRKMAADMTNYVVRAMNDRIVSLKTGRSKENRIFLENRLDEIAGQLKRAEDSLRVFQERTGLLDAKTQLQGILTAHTKLETELTAKRFQQGILERLYDPESPQVKEMDIQIQEFQKKLEQLRSQGNPGSPFLPLKKLPWTSVEFLRRYREVELNNLIMEFVVPLCEQAKIEEKRDYPVLQVIDYAVPPAKKSWPPRILLALMGALSVTIIVSFLLRAREAMMKATDNRLLSILRGALNWKWKATTHA
jgi:tyrosine-protein kinase Etk/Wzc